jgi:nitric oxide reductase NorQ protein
MPSTMTERLPTAVYTARSDVPWSDVWNLHPLFDQLAFRANLLLQGPKGIGKTLSFQTWAARNRCPIVTFDCSEDVRRSHLLGMYVLRGSETPWVMGPLTTAVDIANEVGRCLLVLEELNGLTPQMQKVLNPLSDFRRRIEVPECGRVFSLEPGAQLWLVGTLNATAYGGVYALNEDLKSRFRMLALDYPSPEAERALVASHFPDGLDTALLDKVMLLARESRQKALEYALSPRDLVQLLEDARVLGVKRALRLVLGKFEGADAETVKQRIHSIFHVKLTEAP